MPSPEFPGSVQRAGIAAQVGGPRDGVKILGFPNLPGRVPVHASQIYSTNLVNFLEEFWDRNERRFVLRLEDEIIRSSLLTHAGEICHPMFNQNSQREVQLCKNPELWRLSERSADILVRSV
jgi:hypothetical protein